MTPECTTQLKKTFREIENATARLTELLADCHLLAARVFVLPERHKGTEEDEIDHITVQSLSGQLALDKACQHWRHFFIQQQSAKQSSKAAVRLPGVVCPGVTAQQYSLISGLIEQINQLKARLQKIIVHDAQLPPGARFEWVHQHLPGLITLSAWRQITCLSQPATLGFGWANKQIIKNLTRQDVLTLLEKSLRANRSVAPWSREQWHALVSKEYQDIARLPESATLKIRRPVKVQPIARVWYPGQQKQQQYACPSPMVVLCQQHEGIPDIGELTDYDAGNITWRHKPQPQVGRLIIPRLHLWVMNH